MKNKESPFGPVSETQFTKDGTPIPKVAPSAQEQAAARAVKETTKDERYQRRRARWDDYGFIYPFVVAGMIVGGSAAWDALQGEFDDSRTETPPPATAEPFEYDEDDPYFDDGILPGNPNVPADQDGGTPDNPGSNPAYSTTIPETTVPEENLGYEDMKPPMGP